MTFIQKLISELEERKENAINISKQYMNHQYPLAARYGGKAEAFSEVIKLLLTEETKTTVKKPEA